MANVFEMDMELKMNQNERSPPVWPKFMCEQLHLFAEMKYLASRQLWNLQTLKVPDTNF